MINDFDFILNKCKTRALKRVFRIVFRILGSIVLVGLGIFGYYQWKISTQPTIIVKPLPKAVVPVIIKEENTTIVPISVPTLVKTTIARVPVPATIVVPTTPLAIVAAAAQPAPISKNKLLEVSNASSTPMTPEQTYQRSQKFETALGIAREFYVKEEYPQAATWAKKANQMNREAEEAWLLYAKSYYSQGKKSEAIGVLELYLNYKDSKAASDLIKAWR